jgi:hypothetical protein
MARQAPSLAAVYAESAWIISLSSLAENRNDPFFTYLTGSDVGVEFSPAVTHLFRVLSYMSLMLTLPVILLYMYLIDIELGKRSYNGKRVFLDQIIASLQVR